MFPRSVTELLDIKESCNFCFIHRMDTHFINEETLNIHYTKHHFWEQEGILQMLNRTINSLSFEAYNKQFRGYMGSEVGKKPSDKLQNEKDKFVELSLVDAMFELWKLRWTIIRAKDELIAQGVLKKYKHLDDLYIFKTSSEAMP